MTGARRALIVAGDTYEHEGLRRLRSPRADAAALEAVLADPQIGGFEVRVVLNQPSHEVQARIEDLFADSRPDDLLLLHLACHGVKNEAGELYFAALNTRLDRLASTAVSADFVQRGMRASRSRSIVLLLDCCYGGAFGRGVSVRAAGPANVLDSFPSTGLDGGRGRAVITASNAMEYAFEGDVLADDHSAPTSVFTDALVRGLATGEADRDEDGWVSLNELYDYVFDRVRTTTPGQTPTRDVQMQGELYLARSRRRRVRAAPMPPDLLAASNDTNAFTRLGAVSELRARLLGDNVPAAAGAYDRLTEIAQGDIRHVADAAAAALREAALGVPVDEVSFGEVPLGAEPPHRTLVLSGPPFARTCSVESSDRRVRAEEVTGGIDVWLDTARPGPVDAVLTVTGPTGEGRVSVHAVVTAPAPEPHAPDPEPAPESRAPDPEPTPRRRRASVPTPSPAGPAAVDSAAPAPAAPPRPSSSAAAGPSWDRVVAAGALVGAALLVVGVANPFRWGSTLRDEQPELFWHAPVLASLAVAGAALVLVPRTRYPAGAGALLGVAAASTWGLAMLGTAWWNLLGPEGGAERGYWLLLAGHVVLLLTGGYLVRSVLGGAAAGTGGTGQGPDDDPRHPHPDRSASPAGRLRSLGWADRSALVVGLLGAAAMVVRAADPAGADWDWTASVWLAVLAAGVPFAALVACPVRLGGWVVTGWAVAGGAIGVAYLLRDARVQPDDPTSGSAAVVAFGLSMAVLLVLGAVAARRDGRGSAASAGPAASSSASAA